MSTPFLGHELADLQPVPVPLLRLFEWSSENSPQEGISNILSSQLGGKVMPSDRVKKTPSQLEALSPSAAQLWANFECLALATMTALLKSPDGSPTLEFGSSSSFFFEFE